MSLVTKEQLERIRTNGELRAFTRALVLRGFSCRVHKGKLVLLPVTRGECWPRRGKGSRGGWGDKRNKYRHQRFDERLRKHQTFQRRYVGKLLLKQARCPCSPRDCPLP